MTAAAIDSERLAFLRANNLGHLVTLKRDGRPQISNINYHVNENGVIRISVTDGRAKVRNLRRDPRASLHVEADSGWRWLVAEGTAELSPVAQDRHDATVEELIDLYRAISGEHPDWDDYRRAMVEDGRLVLHITIEHTYGQLSQ